MLGADIASNLLDPETLNDFYKRKRRVLMRDLREKPMDYKFKYIIKIIGWKNWTLSLGMKFK